MRTASRLLDIWVSPEAAAFMAALPRDIHDEVKAIAFDINGGKHVYTFRAVVANVIITEDAAVRFTVLDPVEAHADSA